MSSPTERAFVYVANAESRELLVFRMSPGSGELTLVQHLLGGKFTTLAYTPDRRFLFAGLRDEPFGIASFAIDPMRGTLQPLGEQRMPGPLAFVSVDRTGRCLLAASYHNDFLAVAMIDADGAICAPHQLIASVPKAHSILAAPTNDFVVAAALGGDRLLAWPFDAASGRLDESKPSELTIDTGAGPRHVRFHPGAQRLFLICELDGSVRSIEYDDSLRFRQVAIATVMPPGFRGKRWAAELHVAPSGRFVFGSERTSSTLSAFSVDHESGSLEVQAIVPTERQPRAFAIDPEGRFLYVVGQKSNRLSSYAIDQETGVPTKLNEYAVGQDPCWVEVLAFDV